MKINKKFNFVLGVLLLIGDFYVLYNGIYRDLNGNMVIYMLFSHFGAAFYAREIESENVFSVVLVPGILLFEGNMTPEWKRKYDWTLSIPVIAFFLFCVAAMILA